MRNRKIFSLILFGVVVMSRAQQPMTLNACVDYALSHNIDIAQRAIEIEQQHLDLSDAKNSWLPRVNAEASDRFVPHQSLTIGYLSSFFDEYIPKSVALNNVQAGVSASMPLFTGGRLQHQRASSQFALQAVEHMQEAARKDLRVQVASYYLQVLYQKSLAEVARQQLVLSGELLSQAQTLYDKGRCPVSDVAEAESQRAAAHYNLRQCDGEVALSLLSLAHLLNIEQPDSFDVDDPSLSPSLLSVDTIIPLPGQTYADIVERYPSILASKANIDAMHHQVDASRAAFLPQVSLMASLSTGFFHVFNDKVKDFVDDFGDQLTRNFTPIVGVNVSYNIFNGHQTRNNVRRAELAVRNSELSLERSRTALRQQLQQAYQEAVTAVDNYRAAVTAEQSAHTSFDYSRKKFDAGKMTLVDLHRSQLNWIEARQRVLQSKFNYLVRRQILQFYTDEI